MTANAPGENFRETVAVVEAVSDACLLTSRAIFEKAGGFDEHFHLEYYDWDYCLRVRDLGYRVLVDTAAECIHYGNLTRRYIDTSVRTMDHRQFMMKHGMSVTEREVA